MLRLESYITPFLTSYLNRFILNLTSEDLKLSIWGGDVVLTNLKLRLDILEAFAGLPFVIQSGHIHELRIHIPWMALTSESVEVTISTIEVALKLQTDETANETDSVGTKSPRSTTSAENLSPTRASQSNQGNNIDAPPGYIESLLLKIKNNLK